MALNIMGKKRGMTQLFDEKGRRIVCTVIEAEPNIIVQVKKGAVQVGAFEVKESKRKNVTKPLKGHFAKAKVIPRRSLRDSRIGEGEEYQVGQEIGVGYFAETVFVDVIGTSKGKGFQGVMKRHGFSGGPAAHGSGFHRTAGSTGANTNPGRVFLNKKMAGHMGDEKVTVEGLRVMKIDQEKNVILVKGAIPGSRNATVMIRKSKKRS